MRGTVFKGILDIKEILEDIGCFLLAHRSEYIYFFLSFLLFYISHPPQLSCLGAGVPPHLGSYDLMVELVSTDGLDRVVSAGIITLQLVRTEKRIMLILYGLF